MQDVYLIISNYENRSKVHGVCTKDKALEHFNLMCSIKPESWVKEIIKPFMINYYTIDDDGNKVFQEQLYIEKRQLLSN